MIVRRVRGRSMMPALAPETVVIASKSRHIKNGAIVIARAPSGREIIKRVERHDRDRYYLVGDNRLESTDSREFGVIDKSAILGVVIMKIKLATASPPKPINDKRFLVFPYAAALLILIILLAQLVTFDKFETAVEAIAPNWGKVWLALLAVSEVFALPFLLRMRMSRLARFVSLLLGYAVVLEWLTLINLAVPLGVTDIPLLGTFAHIIAVKALSFLFLLLVLVLVSHVVLGGESIIKLPARRLKK